MRLAVILLAAGAGVRLEAGQPKAFARVAGRTVLEHAYDHVARHPAVDRVIVTAPMSAAERVAALIPREARVVAGGATRQESVRLALGLLEADA
ncbi:MAG: 2-C-methyl-D-erythritol 4-phosphate cytidylyltransferase, partial [bacterium]